MEDHRPGGASMAESLDAGAAALLARLQADLEGIVGVPVAADAPVSAWLSTLEPDDLDDAVAVLVAAGVGPSAAAAAVRDQPVTLVDLARQASRVAAASTARSVGRTPAGQGTLAGLVRVRPVTERDARWLLSVLHAPVHQRRVPPAPSGAGTAARSPGDLLQCAVELFDGAEGIGLGRAFDADLGAQRVQMGVHVADGYASEPEATAAVAEVARCLFDRWPIRRIYVHVPAFDAALLTSTELFDKEALLRRYQLFAGELWDVEIRSLSRDGFEGRFRPLLCPAGP